MERSGWFDDDDESSPRPLPEDRAWRHPSELGMHGAYGAPARRRHGLRFAGALALGSAGTIAFAVLTSMQLFGGGLERSSGLDVMEGSLFSIASAPTSMVLRATTAAPAPTEVAVTATSTPTTAPSRTVASMPPAVGVRVGGASATVPAVIDDDGFVLTGTDDLAGASEAEVVLDDGSVVAATLDSVDDASGVARLRPATSVPVPTNQTTAWLGVTCADDTEATTTPADPGAGTTVPAPTTAASAPPDTSTTPTSVPAAAAVPTSTTPGTARPPTGPTTTAAAAPSTTSLDRARIVTTPAAPASVATAPPPATDEAPTSTGGAVPTPDPSSTTTTSVPSVAGVRVHRVHDASPAAVAGVQAGDLIVAVDGRAVHSRWALVLAVRRHTVGDVVHVELRRDGRPLVIDVTLAAGPAR